MFYSDTLLAKNGPLARVWLASNMERKLTKQTVLAEKLETKVHDIIGADQAPMALRMSGQLLLGVVIIYRKKAKYLLDDCSEALSRIRLAFRPGSNVDLPSNQGHADPKNLMLADTITELDLFAPLPDPDDFLRDDVDRTPGGRGRTFLDFGDSQLLPDSLTPRRQEKRVLDEDDDLDLEFGLDPLAHTTSFGIDRSIEVGRRAPTPRRDDPTQLNLDDDLDLGLEIDYPDTSMAGPPLPIDDDVPILDVDKDYVMEGAQDPEIEAANAAAFARVEAAANRRERDSVSPLSSIGSSVERQFEQSFHPPQLAQEDDEELTVAQAPQRVKRRKVMAQDEETELHSKEIRAQQEDTSAITKAPKYLPRDPLLLLLMEMQRNGSFVSNVMGDGRMQGWAPELRGIFSMEVVRSAGDKKRKRDSGIADVETSSERQETPRLEFPEEEQQQQLDEGFGGADDFANPTLRPDGLAPMSDGLQPPEQQQDDDEDDFAATGQFDITEAPLLHPAESGPVSLGTKNAVHLLREHFAPGHAATSTQPPTPSKRMKNDVLFADLCPEDRTSRQDATKMFFELLVLGTKDAIKVSQDTKELGLPIRVRGKRGLWGDWAETSASQVQEVAEEAEA